MTRILIADADRASRAFLADNLAADGYDSERAFDRGAAELALDRWPFDLVLADLDGESLAFLDAVRRRRRAHGATDPQVPVVLLGRDGGAMARQRAYERGADDYVTRPFSYPELRARVANLLRRTGQARPGRILAAGALSVDLDARRATVAGREVELSGKEWELLVALAAQPERVFTKAELLRDVWQFQCNARTRTVDSHACRLRRKLEDAGARGLVDNVWGVGYRLCGRTAVTA